MSQKTSKIYCLIITLAMLLSMLPIMVIGTSAASASGITDAAGWFESAYAEWAPVSGASGYNAYVAPAGSSSWTKIDAELIRNYGSYYRVDAVGLKAGDYQIKIAPIVSGAEQGAMVSETLTVEAYDRSGFAHFNYADGVGAYNDDGTLKSNAIVIYVTNENKDTVSVTSKDGTTVSGIGNILNSVGQDTGSGKNSKGGVANTNADILRKLALDGTPLVVRIVGNVTAPDGLTAFDSIDYGGSVGDNGFMARMSGGKDITIEGIGFDATINGWGLHFICQTDDYKNGIGKSFEVRNIAFKNVPEDCVGMEGQQENSTLTAPVERCWIHHCTFYAPTIANPAESDKSGGDGACDFKRGQYFTNSYCYYEGYHKTNLVGSSDDSLQYHISYHHNYWKDCESRGPLARQADIHMYNNIFEGQVSYVMSLRANSYIFSEYNMFIKCKQVVDGKTGGVCKSYNNSFTSCSFGGGKLVIVDDKSETVSSDNKYANFDTNASLSYIPSGDYILQEDLAEAKATVLAYAGHQKENIKRPDEVNTSVIPADRYPTAALVLDYSKSMNNATVMSTKGVYDNIVFNVKKVASDCITVGGSANDCDIVFYVNTEVNISMTAVSGDYLPVLCNAIGEEIILGTGSASKLPSGFYFIQSSGYDVGSAKYKEAKLSSLTVTAVDPNAATQPLPTPPVVDPDDNNGGDNNGSGSENGSGNTGDNGGGTTLPAGSYTHNFTENGKEDPKGFFNISGNLSTSKGTVTYNGLELTTCLKIESSTSISFNAPEKGTLVLVFGGSANASGKQIKVDGTKVDIDSTQIVSMSVEAGNHTVTKDDSINLFYIAYYSDGLAEHTHEYVEEVQVAPTCITDGISRFVCSCGDSYGGVIDALGHKYRDGECLNCGEADPEYKPDDSGDGPVVDPGDEPTVNPGDEPTVNPGDVIDPTPDEEPEVKLNFFQKIWKAIVDFFKMLFGIK